MKWCETIWRWFGWTPKYEVEEFLAEARAVLKPKLEEKWRAEDVKKANPWAPSHISLEDYGANAELQHEGLAGNLPAKQAEQVETVKYVEVVKWANPINHPLAKGVAKGPAGAFPFYRDGKYFVVICDFNLASGIRPQDFVPDWLEQDKTRPTESVMETGLGQTTILYKIPIRGWDTETVVGEYEGQDHATYNTDGEAILSAKEFSPAGLPGCRGFYKYRPNEFHGRCDVFLFAEEVGRRKVVASTILPPGLELDTTRAVKFRAMGVGAGKLVCYEIPTLMQACNALPSVKSVGCLPPGSLVD